MIRIERLEVAGFRSVKEKVVLSMPTGAFLIEGDNGSGKTTLFREAAWWLLFGTNLRGEYIANIINRESEKAEIVGVFDIPGIGKATATRSRTASGKQPFTFVDANGRDLLVDAGTASKGLTDPVERLFGMRAATIRASSFYSPTESLMSLGDTARRELLEDAFGLDWIRDARDKFTKAYVQSEAVCARLKLEHATLSSRAQSQRQAAEEFTKQAAAAKARVTANTTVELERLNAELATKQQLLGDAHMAYASTNGLRENIKREVDAAAASVTALTDEKNRLEIKRAGVESTIASIDKQCAHLDRELRMVSSGGKDNCPTCMRPFGPEHREAILKELADSKSPMVFRRKQLDEELVQLYADIDQLKVALAPDSGIIVGYNSAVATHNDFAGECAKLQAAIAQLEGTINNIYLPAIAKLQRTPADADATVRALEESAARADAEAVAAQAAATMSQSMLADEVKRTERLSWWKAALGPKGVRAFVLEGMLPQLSRLASYYLGKMSDYQQAVEITPTKVNKKGVSSETIDIRVMNVRGLDSYDDCSAGERRKADLALTLALYDTARAQGGKGLGYLLLDEALDPLSQDAAKGVVDLLQELGVNGMSVGVVSHSDAVRGHFSTIMQVSREPAGWTTLGSTVDGVVRTPKKAKVVLSADEKALDDLTAKIVARMKELGCTQKQRAKLIAGASNNRVSTLSSMTLVEAEKLHVMLLTQETAEE